MPLPVVIRAGQWLPAMCRDRTAGMYGAKIRIILLACTFSAQRKKKTSLNAIFNASAPF